MKKNTVTSVMINGVEYITKAEFCRRNNFKSEYLSEYVTKRDAPCYLHKGGVFIKEPEMLKWIEENKRLPKHSGEGASVWCSVHVMKVIKRLARESGISIRVYMERCFGHMEE